MASLTPLANSENSDFTHIIEITPADANSYTSGTAVAVGTLPANAAVEIAVATRPESFVGAADNNFTIDVGLLESEPDEWVNSYTPGTTGQYNGGSGFSAAGNPELISTSASDQTVYLELTGSTGASALYTSGKAVIGLRIVDPNRFS